MKRTQPGFQMHRDLNAASNLAVECVGCKVCLTAQASIFEKGACGVSLIFIV